MSSSHLKTAIIDTEVTQGFYTHQTQHAGDTVEYLSGMHNQIVAAVLVHADQRVGGHICCDVTGTIFFKRNGNK